MSIEEFLEKLDGVKGSGSQYMARCPAHDDQHASLSIGEGNDGQILVSCHVGCDAAEVVAEMGLKMSDLFPDNPARRNRNGRNERRIVETYDYVGVDGDLLHQKVRYQPKDFRQRRPDGNDGWIWNLDDVETVLYRLPQVIEAIEAGRRIYLVEGEQDADRLVEHGLDATTWTEGASKGKPKWKPQYTESLRGACVVLVPDNDEPGRKSMQDIARALHGVAADIRTVEIPGLTELKQDVSDWLDQGNTADDLRKLADAAPMSEPTDTDDEVAPTGPTGRARATEDPMETARLISELCTDVANAKRFDETFGPLFKWVLQWGWLAYDGTRWKCDDEQRIVEAAKSVGQQVRLEAATQDSARVAKAMFAFAKKSESNRGIQDFLALARPMLHKSTDEFDRDPFLLNFKNCTLSLKRREKRPHNPDDLITKLIPRDYVAGKACPLWEESLERILPDRAMRDFLQRAVGYSLTGSTEEQVFFISWGKGANGKSTVVNTILDVLGSDYAQQADPRSFLVSGNDGAIRSDLARMRGARFLSAIETGDGKRLDEPLIKAMTGGDPLVARELYKKPFQFKPSFKLWMATNHKPEIRGTDHAMWRRIRLIPFTETIPPEEQDKKLSERLMCEAEGILAWMVEGAYMWLADGLKAPEAVTHATNDYRRDEDLLGDFIAERCDLNPQLTGMASKLFDAFKDFTGDTEIKQTRFGTRMTERGFERKIVRGRKAYRGIGLKIDEESPSG